MSQVDFESQTGLTIEEAKAAEGLAAAYLDSAKARVALEILRLDAAPAEKASRDALHRSWTGLFSKTGKTQLALLRGDDSPRLRSFRDYISHQISDPALVRDLAVWALFFAARESSDSLQLDHCPKPTSESHLSGDLIGALAAACERWRQAVAGPLGRLDASLSVDKIDLSILGGEQVTGGDFGLILDLDGRSIQPSEKPSVAQRRIVPLIFQAKRYVRPSADVSQRHRSRGHQRDFLSANPAKSAYIFYENGSDYVKEPLPPLVKPIEEIENANRTDAVVGSLEFATYLVTCLSDPGVAPSAATPGEALGMIYAAGKPGRIAVISSDRHACSRYQQQLNEVVARRRGDTGRQHLSTSD